MLPVERRVDAEVRRRPSVCVEAVVRNEPGELRARDLRLRRLDRIEHGPRLERIRAPPGLRARERSGHRFAPPRSAQRLRERIPHSDVICLLPSVLRVARGSRRLPERDARVPVFARIERELLARQLAVLPAAVERMAEHVPPCADLVDSPYQLHLPAPPFPPKRPRAPILRERASRSARPPVTAPRRETAPTAGPVKPARVSAVAPTTSGGPRRVQPRRLRSSHRGRRFDPCPARHRSLLRLSGCAFFEHRCEHPANQALEVRLARRVVSEYRGHRLQGGSLAERRSRTNRFLQAVDCPADVLGGFWKPEPRPPVGTGARVG